MQAACKIYHGFCSFRKICIVENVRNVETQVERTQHVTRKIKPLKAFE